MRLTEQNDAAIFRTNRSFASSIRLATDWSESARLKGYIVTNDSSEVLQDLLFDESSSQASAMLMGSYGTGKSHLAAIVANLLSEDKDRHLWRSLANDVGAEGKELPSHNYVIAPIASYERSLNESVLQALNSAAQKHNIEKLSPPLKWKYINQTVRQWQDDFPNIYDHFTQYLDSISVTVSEFLVRLKHRHHSAIDIFEEFWRLRTGGQLPEGTQAVDALASLEEAVNAAKENGYSGIYLMMDEFNRVLERAAAGGLPDIGLVQDIAELAVRSDGGLRLLLIAHKTIRQYAGGLSEDVVDEWQKIQGRFNVYYLSAIDYPMEKVIPRVVPRTEHWSSVKARYEMFLDELVPKLGLAGQSLPFEDSTELLPLHPVSVPVLAAFAEQTAQNQRSVFTYLSNIDKRFLNGEEWVLPPDVFAYFEPAIRRDTNTYQHTVWLQLQKAKQKLPPEGEEYWTSQLVPILETVAVFQMLDVPHVNITPDSLRLALVHPRTDRQLDEQLRELDTAIDYLLDNRILVHRRASKEMDFVRSSDIDIEMELEEIRANLESAGTKIRTILNEDFSPGPILPRKHNEQHKIVRRFHVVYVEDWDEVVSLEVEPEEDGLVALLLNDREFPEDDYGQYDGAVDRGVVAVKPRSFSSGSLRELVFRYEALKHLLSSKKGSEIDAMIIEEIQIHLQEIREQLEGFLERNFLRFSDVIVRWRERVWSATTPPQLSRILSEISNNYYRKAPLINSELIQRNKLSAPIKRARKMIVAKLLEGSEITSSNLGFEGGGPEVTISRACFDNKGLIAGDGDADIRRILDVISDRLIDRAIARQKPVRFSEIYNTLLKSPYGMRKGPIPIYLAYVLRHYRSVGVIQNTKSGEEEQIKASTLETANAKPETYGLIIIEDSGMREYCDSIQEIWPTSHKGNQFHIAVRAVREWFNSLPKYSRVTTRSISDTSVKFRQILQNKGANPREIVAQWEESFTPRMLSRAKKELEEATNALIEEIGDSVTVIWGVDSNADVSQLLRDWYEEIVSGRESTLTPRTAIGQLLLDVVSEAQSRSEQELSRQLAETLTDLSIEDWSDPTLGEFRDSLKEAKRDVEQVHSMDITGNEKGTESVLVIKSGERQYQVVLDDVSDLGRILRKRVEETLAGFSGALTRAEMRSILWSLFEDYL